MAKAAKKIKTRTQVKSFDQKHYGDEPIIVGSATESQLMDAFNWYNYMSDMTKGKSWLIEYLKKDGRDPQLIRDIRSAIEWRTPTTTCWMARMMLNGTTFNEAYMARFNERVAELARHGVKEVKPTVKTNVISIQDRIKRNIDNMICDAEEELDKNAEFSMYNFLTAKQASVQAANTLRDFYKRSYDEVMSGDEQVKESYGKTLKFWQKVYGDMMHDFDRYLNNKKVVKVRAPKAIKIKPAADLVKWLKYQPTDSALKLASVNPQSIIGATQLWVYNTKTRRIGFYQSNAPKGFMVKGTSVTGFDPELSISKTLRKPEEQLKEFFGLGKVGLRKFLDTVKTAGSPLNGRINSETILLKVT